MLSSGPDCISEYSHYLFVCMIVPFNRLLLSTVYWRDPKAMDGCLYFLSINSLLEYSYVARYIV